MTPSPIQDNDDFWSARKRSNFLMQPLLTDHLKTDVIPIPAATLFDRRLESGLGIFHQGISPIHQRFPLMSIGGVAGQSIILGEMLFFVTPCSGGSGKDGAHGKTAGPHMAVRPFLMA